MANFLWNILSGTAKAGAALGTGTVKAGYRAAFAPTRTSRLWNTGLTMGAGGLIGGVTAAFQDDSDSPTQRFKSILGGAIYGAGIVGGVGVGVGLARAYSNRMGKIAAKRGISRFALASERLAGTAGKMYGAGKTIGDLGLSLATFAIKHPLAIGVGAGGMYGAAYALRLAGPDSPTMRGVKVNTNYDLQNIAAENMRDMGIAPMGQVGTYPEMARPMQRAMEQSTTGLVQGMHRGRHG